MSNLEERLAAAEAENEQLRARLAYYESRPQEMLDGLAKWFQEQIEKGELNTGLANVIRQFLRDQGIVDLKSGSTPVNNLARVLPFTAPDPGGDDIGAKAE